MSDNTWNDENLPWLQDDDEPGENTDPKNRKLGVTGQLPWLKGVSDADTPAAEDDSPTFDWGNQAQETSAPSEGGVSVRGLTGTLPWNEQASGGTQPSSSDDLRAWLDAQDAEDEEEPPAAQEEDLPAWLRDSSASPDDTLFGSNPPLSASDTPAWLGASTPSASVDDTLFGGNFSLSDADAPAWLSQSTPQADEPQNDDEDMPAWLSSMGGEAETAQASTGDFDFGQTADSYGSTDYSDTDFDFEDEPAPAEPVREDLPDWLRASAAPMESTPEDSGFDFGGSESGSGAGNDAGLPDWINTPAASSGGEFDFSQLEGVEGYGEPQSPYGDMTYDEWERQQAEAEQEAQTPKIDMPMPDLFADMGAPSGTGNLASGDYVPEWFMGVEELSEEDAPDWFRRPDAAPKPPTAPIQQQPPAPPPQAAPMPDFSAFEPTKPATGGIRRIESNPLTPLPATPPGGEAPVSLDDLFGEDDAESDELDWLVEDEPSTDAAPDFDSMFGEAVSPAASPASEGLQLPSTGDLIGGDWLSDEPVASPPSPIKPIQPLAAPPAAADIPDFDNLLEDDSEPDWLRDYDQEAEAAQLSFDSPPAPSFEMLPAADETPDWFGGVDFSSVGVNDSAEPSEADDFLSGLSAGFDAPSAKPAAQVSSAQTGAGVFDLDALLGSDITLPSSTGIDLAGQDDDLRFDDDFGDFAAPADIPATAFDETPAAIPAENIPFAPPAAAASEGRRGWRGRRGQAEQPPAEESAETASEDIPLAQPEFLPDWLRQQIGEARTDYVLRVGGVETRYEQVPDVVLPPDVRRLREQMLEHLTSAAALSGLVNSGPLSGIENPLRLDPTLATPGSPKLGRNFRPTATQEVHVQTLQQVLEVVEQETSRQRIEIRYDLDDDEDELEELTPAAPPPARSRRKLDRVVITVLLLLAVVAPFFTEALHVAEDPRTDLDQGGRNIAAAVDGLAALNVIPAEVMEASAPQAESLRNFASPFVTLDETALLARQEDQRVTTPVLFAFEYGATASQELDPLAEAVLRDVLVNGGKPVILSTNPTGVLHAQNLMAALAADETLLAAMNREDSLQAGEDYIVLRYIGGGLVGVRALGASEVFAATTFAYDVEGRETGLEVANLNGGEFAFLVVVGERLEDVRIWSEQTGDLSMPMFALVTSAAEPLARPYVAAGQYQGLLGGSRGALMYNVARNAQSRAAFDADAPIPDPGVSGWHSRGLAAGLAALLVAFGAALNILRGLRRRSR